MLKLNCLINDTRAIDDIKNAIQLLVGDRLENSKSVTFQSIYSEIRNAGLEIDAESAGFIYNEIYGKYDDGALSTEDEIMEFSGKDVTDQQKAIVDNIISSEPTIKEKQIGKLPPEKQVANMIAKLFQDATFEPTKNVNTVMKQMETLVARAAKTLLPPAQQKATKGLFENLTDFFTTEKAQFETLSGGVNTLETLHTAVKNEVDNYINQITPNLSDEDAQEFTDKWAEYTNGFIQSTYDLMLGKSDQNKLLNESLKQVEVDGVQIVDLNGNVKWQTLMEQGNPNTISDNVKQLFVNGIKDEQGNVQKYSLEEANRIGDYFERLYKTKLASVIQQKSGNERSKNLSAKNIISDFIKDLGFINLVKDKDGKLLLTQANWSDALETIKRQVGQETGIDIAVQKLNTFLSKQEKPDGSKKFTKQQIDIITKEFKQTIAAKLVPGTASPHALDRLIALKNLNSGKSFQESTQSALNNVLGVGGLNQSTIYEIRKLTQATQNIIAGNNVTGSTSDNLMVNRGAYAFQQLSKIERRIKEIIRENKISRSNQQRIVKYISDNLNMASTSLLINPGNFGENIITGFASNLGESVTMAITNPKLFTKLGGDFWTAFASHFFGGVANEVIVDQEISSDIQSGERLRVRAFLDELSKGWGSAAGAIAKLPAYAVSIVNRTIMNSFDAGFNSSILRKKAVTSMYNALLANGLTPKEALAAMDKALNIDEKTNKELDIENNRIKIELNKVGIRTTVFDMEQNKRDMKLSLYFDALGAAALKREVKTTPKQLREASMALIESSQLQAKVLTGKKQIPVDHIDIVNNLIYQAAKGVLGFQQKYFAQQQELEQQGNLKGAASAQLKGEIYKNTIGRFAGGIANFLALAITATPYGFVTARSLQNQKSTLLSNKVDAGNVFKAEPGDIIKYAELHNLMRSMVVRAAMGTLAIGGFIAKKLSDDEDDEEDKGWVANLMQTKSGRRLLQKYLPLGVNVAASLLYDVNDKKMDTKMERLMDVLSNTTGQSYDKWTNVKTAISRAKTDEDVWKATASYFGGSLPTLNINQAEQITKFATTLKSAVDEDGISDVKKQENVSKAIYKQAETAIDAMMTNGAIDAFKRILSEDEQFNRFKKKE